MSIESLSPTLFSIGSGGVIGFLVGFAIKKVMKILAVIVGGFLAALIYLQSQSIITDTNQISAIAGNLGIPLTGGLAAGFAIGLMKG